MSLLHKTAVLVFCRMTTRINYTVDENLPFIVVNITANVMITDRPTGARNINMPCKLRQVKQIMFISSGNGPPSQ